MADTGSGIRETEEAHALLQDQLHNLYWWVFNACKMKGFIRAKGLHEAVENRLNISDNSHRISSEPQPITRRKFRNQFKSDCG